MGQARWAGPNAGPIGTRPNGPGPLGRAQWAMGLACEHPPVHKANMTNPLGHRVRGVAKASWDHLWDPSAFSFGIPNAMHGQFELGPAGTAQPCQKGGGGGPPLDSGGAATEANLGDELGDGGFGEADDDDDEAGGYV